VKHCKILKLICLSVFAGILLEVSAVGAPAETAKKESSLLALDAKYAKISQAIEAKLKGVTVRQPSNDLDELYKQAPDADKELRKIATEIAKQTQGEAVLVRLKSRQRAEEKINADYGGDASRVLDISRATIKFGTVDDLYQALVKIDSSPNIKIVRMKDRFLKPGLDGYRDLLLNLKMPNGFITELQLHLKQILAVKKEGHKIYTEMQAIDRKAEAEKRDFTAAELEQKKRLMEQSEALYNQAFESALKKK
jgi:ppGpp synthetase/RelA/SpoT-type nucleotidyltranferase